MSLARSALTPDALAMMEAIAQSGSFAAAARQLGKVPSALTYSVRQLEDALDVLLFDRRSRQATLTAAGQELLHEGRRLLGEIDAVANRVKRVATGWEAELTIAVDDVISRTTLLELCEAFYACSAVLSGSASPGGTPPAPTPPATRLRLRTEVLAGTWEALITGHADLAIGGVSSRELPAGVTMKDLGPMEFVFVVAPHHPLAAAAEPLDDGELVRHRAVAVADSAQRLQPITVNLQPGQDVLTMSDMSAKIDALLRGLGGGFVPEAMARDHIAAGRLVVKRVQRNRLDGRLGYAWRTPVTGKRGPGSRKAPMGLALRWWLEQLESETTRKALLDRHGGRVGDRIR